MSEVKDQDTPKSDLRAGCMACMLWMMVGNIALFFILISFVPISSRALTLTVIHFWSFVVLLFIIRYLEIKKRNGETMFGKPAISRVLQGNCTWDRLPAPEIFCSRRQGTAVRG